MMFLSVTKYQAPPSSPDMLILALFVTPKSFILTVFHLHICLITGLINYPTLYTLMNIHI